MYGEQQDGNMCQLFACLLACLLACLIAWLLACLPAWLPACLLACLIACLRACLLAYLLACLPLAPHAACGRYPVACELLLLQPVPFSRLTSGLSRLVALVGVG